MMRTACLHGSGLHTINNNHAPITTCSVGYSEDM